MQLMTLRSGDATLVLNPGYAGAVYAWTVEGQSMFRPVADMETRPNSPLDCASFALVPYANRIGDARFEWRGEQIQLQRNFPPEPHAIHGVGWEKPWRTEQGGASNATLTLSHAGDASWPWRFEAVQHFCLEARGLSIETRLTNTEDFEVPLACGHHPYFPADGASLRFRADAMWENGEDRLPSIPVSADHIAPFSRGTGAAGLGLDNCFDGWDGKASISWERRNLALEIDADYDHCLLYSPVGGDFFCFEPMAHCSNALASGASFPLLAPGATSIRTVRYDVVEQS